MLIFAKDNCVVFECEHCGANERLESKRRNKRQFQIILNKFHRRHDWRCQYQVERQRKIDDAIETADSIIKQLVKECR